MRRVYMMTLWIALCGLLVASMAQAQERLGGSMPSTDGPQSEGAKQIAKFEYPSMTWDVPQVGRDVERYVTKNGMIIYLKEDHTLPEFRIRALIRCGDVYDPAQRQGISGLVGTVMRSGGTKTLSPDSLNALLEYIAASVETGIGQESGSASLYCLAKDIELGIKTFADVIRNPAFAEDKIDLAKEQIRKAIKSRNDNPGSIVSREFDRTLYGDHPLGRILEWNTVEPIGRADLQAYHDRYFAPNNMMLGITGDFDSKQIKKLLDKYFGDWQERQVDLPSKPKVEMKYRPGVYFIEKDVNQSNIRLGHLGIDEDNPDRYAVSVMNFILGGGSFNSRMTSKVRSDEGLAYSVGSRYQTGTDYPGEFFAYCQTKSSTTMKAIDLMVAEIKRIRDSEVSDAELEMAKDSYINRYVFQFTSASRVVGQLMQLEYFDRPRDLLQNYIANIQKVTKSDVWRVAKEYLHPEDISYVIVGKRVDLDADPAELGTVTEIPLEEPVVN